MKFYFSTFITGFKEIVADHLSKNLKNVEIKLLIDGLVVYETASSIDEIKKLRFLNNSFILLKKFEQVSEDSIRYVLKEFLRDQDLDNIIKQAFPRQNFKFRIRASVKNQFIPIDKVFLRKLENKITKITSNLIVDRSLPEIEFLVTVRSEGFGLIGIQFTHRPNYEKTLAKGELYPELAHLLCLISGSNKNDVFIDPLSGSGAIPIQRAFFPYKKIIAGDNNTILVDILRKKITKLNIKAIVEKIDATHLKEFADNSIDKLVTDPPWGLSADKGPDLTHFYSSLLKEFVRVLKENGIIVILTSQKELLETQLEMMHNQLELVKKYTTLVSGKKAGAYKLKKIINS